LRFIGKFEWEKVEKTLRESNYQGKLDKDPVKRNYELKIKRIIMRISKH